MMAELEMDNTTTMAQTPNNTLALEIADALVAAGLIMNAHKGQLLAKLRTSGVAQEDWNLWIDMATAPETMPLESDNE
jgi:hypothetical protein